MYGYSKGMKLTRERYLDMRATPEGWIPLKELRPVERAVVRAVAYRGAVLPAPEYVRIIAATPPCCWVLLELLDPVGAAQVECSLIHSLKAPGFLQPLNP